MLEYIFEVAAWGKYIYRSDAERNKFEQEIESCDDGLLYFIYSSQYLASLYVVIEGWNTLKLTDRRIDPLLSSYEDYVQTVRRCRNAVYHYQKKYLDDRVKGAVGESEIFTWAGALLDEFIRYMYLYPFSAEGICDESIHLHEEYMELIAWTPKYSGWVRWFETYTYICQYYKGENPELLERTVENDEIINRALIKLGALQVNPYITSLSRL